MSESSAASNGLEATGGDHILIVDDEVAVLRALGRALRRKGFSVEEAADAPTAIALLASREFSLVLSDISMPGMSGVELLRAVRERDLDLPVILMTAVPGIESAVAAVEFGALRYLTKPLDLDELAEAVRNGVRLRKMAALKREALTHAGITDNYAADRAGLEARFGRALDGLWMAYQPIVSWSSHTTFGHEALVRTEEPTLRPPALLLETAERLGRLHDLGRLIRSNVAGTVDGSLSPSVVFVNLHPRDLLDDELFVPDSTFGRLRHRFVLEVTERAALESIQDARARVAQLKQLGFRIALDDLGAGYAGLSSVVQLQPDVVKLDMSLVRNVDAGPVQQHLISSMTRLCNEMGVLTVAEGVETVAERDTLAGLGCDLMQGFLFARPGRPFPEARWVANEGSVA